MITADQLDEKQQVAVERALSQKRRVAAVTGPAGSGKTSIMRIVADELQSNGYQPVIAAPTGKAARRVREATGHEARTIHSLLEYTHPSEIDERTGKPFGDTYPRRHRGEPLVADHVLVDEYAMVNRELHRNLIDALKAGARLIVFGDIEQLPPIEKIQKLAAEPTAFRMLLDKFDGVYLETVHRTAEDSGILSNAQRVLKGVAPRANPEFGLHIVDQPIDKIRSLIHEGDTDFTSLSNQIITPGNKSWVGTFKLNALLQSELMPRRDTLKLPRHTWDKHEVYVGVGDKVVMTKNWYDLECSDASRGVFNGEVGRVVEISDLEEVVIDLEDRIVRVPPAMQVTYGARVAVAYPQKDIQLAYALTTHKCQGSEYQHVIYVMNKSLVSLLNRRNLYTGITRARKRVDVVTDMRSLSLSITTKEPKVFGE
jgi:exodeoxyribonuclease V alpha subunit